MRQLSSVFHTLSAEAGVTGRTVPATKGGVHASELALQAWADGEGFAGRFAPSESRRGQDNDAF
jgi:hypothetical protein